jgi:hypothetical protein
VGSWLALGCLMMGETGHCHRQSTSYKIQWGGAHSRNLTMPYPDRKPCDAMLIYCARNQILQWALSIPTGIGISGAINSLRHRHA